jgi:hypothetical protein
MGTPDQVHFTMGYARNAASVTLKLALLLAIEIVFGKYFTQHWKGAKMQVPLAEFTIIAAKGLTN